MLEKGGFVTFIVLTFVMIFALLLLVFIYAMERSFWVSQNSSYFRNIVRFSALHLAIYDISTGRYKNPMASYNPIFYKQGWQKVGDEWKVTYKVPVDFSVSHVSCSAVELEGDNCVRISSVSEFVPIRVVYGPEQLNGKSYMAISIDD